MTRFLRTLLCGTLAAAPALAQTAGSPPPPPRSEAPAPAPADPKAFPGLTVTSLYRIVPVDEMRTIAFFAYLYPDCSSQGATVMRLTTPPAHGTVSFVPEDSYPRYGPGTPLAACNAKRVPGIKLNFEAAEGYSGLDGFRALVINPDGTAVDLDAHVSIR